jgi:hypothetical protein
LNFATKHIVNLQCYKIQFRYRVRNFRDRIERIREIDPIDMPSALLELLSQRPLDCPLRTELTNKVQAWLYHHYEPGRQWLAMLEVYNPTALFLLLPDVSTVQEIFFGIIATAGYHQEYRCRQGSRDRIRRYTPAILFQQAYPDY